jgi:hypothetical protein
MKTKFRYDYNCKMLIINILVSLLFLLITVASYGKGLIVFCIFGLVFIICLLNTIVLILNQGITVGKKSVLIIDYFWFTRIDLVDLKRVELKEIKKDKKSNWYGLLNEFYHPSTYMYNSDYVYNNGRVFKIIFYLGDNSTRESYFGWMYKEKSITRVNKVVNKLENFISEINLLIQKKQKHK